MRCIFTPKEFHFTTTDSTQAQARNYVKQNGIHHGEWLLFSAEEQTFGKGTHARKWASPPSVNIYATYAFVVKEEEIPFIANIPQVASFSVIEVLREYGLQPSYKWINDVLLGGKKICGVLAETDMRSTDGRNYQAIAYLGVGLNVNMLLRDLKGDQVEQLKDRVTSMKMYAGKHFTKQEVLTKLSVAVVKNMQLLFSNGFGCFAGKLGKIFETFGEKEQWFDIKDGTSEHEFICGTIQGLSEKGGLILKTALGIKEFVCGRL